MLRSEDLKIIKEISPNAYSFLCSQLSPDTPEGRYDLGEGCYVSVETYTTFKRTERKYENHHDYVDVQIVLSGEEIIEIAPVQELRCISEYNAERDIAFYNISFKGMQRVLKEGECLFIYPGQAHIPCLTNKKKYRVKKAVIKIPTKKLKKLFVMDIDGTLTDGKIYISETGELFKSFNVKDGYGISTILPLNAYIPVVITGRNSEIVKQRCKELGIAELIQNCKDKKKALLDIAAKHGIFPDENGMLPRVVYVGDDIPDYECMMIAEIKACPADAVEEIKRIATYVCKNKAGDGAVREFIERLVKQQ